ncbi:MAG: DNA-protecting protein DprA, partial [Candidatus Gracilibacteria bacterium]|nr:DNA-protecting protein DprA [Candidatus Gracilibacteria bacterium]
LIIPDLVNYFTIVSGGAGGCDSLAHKIALEKKGKTIVVFGTGIDVCYPEINRGMFENIIDTGGGLLSIFPIGTIGSNFTFPIRNEIVSGISSGVLVLQAQKKSGTLITANLALEQSRDLFCVPGDIFSPDFEGCNDLIKSGSAKLVTKSEDILEEYNLKTIPKNKKIPIFDTQIEADIFELLKYNLSLNVDEILEKTNYNYAEITINLSSLELSGIIKKDLFGKYEIIF